MNYTYRNLENVCSEFLSKKQIRCVETSTQKDTQRLSSRERPPPVSDHGLRSSRLKVISPETRVYVARNSSRLFRLTTASLLKDRVLFTQLSRLFCLIIA